MRNLSLSMNLTENAFILWSLRNTNRNEILSKYACYSKCILSMESTITIHIYTEFRYLD